MKRLIASTLLLLTATSLYAAAWEQNTRPRREISSNDFPYLDPVERVKDLMTGTQYMAIVYPTAQKILIGDHTSVAVRATVEYTVYGKEYKTISFVFYRRIPNYPILVGLCGVESDGLYAPDLGYEIPATEKVIEIAKRYTGIKPKPVKGICDSVYE